MVSTLKPDTKNESYLRNLYQNLTGIADPFVHGGQLSRPECELIWQFLRLNRNYQKEYTHLFQEEKRFADTKDLDKDEVEILRQDFCTKYMISMPVCPSIFIFPEQVKFKPVFVRAAAIKDSAMSRTVLSTNFELMRRDLRLQSDSGNMLVVFINPSASQTQIYSAIDKAMRANLFSHQTVGSIRQKKSSGVERKRRGSELAVSRLMTSLICYLSLKTDSLWQEGVKKMSKEHTVNTLIKNILRKQSSTQNGSSIKNRIVTFHDMALQSPQLFVYARKA